MKAAELTTKNKAELVEELRKAQKEAFNLRFQHKLRSIKSTARMRQVRRDIAKILTILNNKSYKE